MRADEERECVAHHACMGTREEGGRRDAELSYEEKTLGTLMNRHVCPGGVWSMLLVLFPGTLLF